MKLTTEKFIKRSKQNVQKSDQMIEELNRLRNKGFLFLTEKERKRFNELRACIEKKAV